MTVLSDFTQIVGDSGVNIPATVGNAVVPLPDFGTGGRLSSETALLVASVRNLAGSATVLINGNNVGSFTATSGSLWSTQLIAVSGGQLTAGMNEIVLSGVTDAFSLKDLICFFHQSD